MAHETIYQAVYVQAKGGLRREVAAWLRTGRAMRRPRDQPDQRRPRMATDMILISQRPAEVADRAVPGHWEGDLIMGAHNLSAIGTLVERTTRFVLLLHLPNGYGPAAVRDALITKIRTLPEQLRLSLTWDQGQEMHFHGQFTTATDMPGLLLRPTLTPGNAGPTRTPMACCASTSPKAPTSRSTASSTSTPWQPNSTADPA